MPAYDYSCVSCGPFTAIRPMAASDRIHRCPDCGQDSARIWLKAPAILYGNRAFKLRADSVTPAKSTRTHGGRCPCCHTLKRPKRAL